MLFSEVKQKEEGTLGRSLKKKKKKNQQQKKTNMHTIRVVGSMMSGVQSTPVAVTLRRGVIKVTRGVRSLSDRCGPRISEMSDATLGRIPENSRGRPRRVNSEVSDIRQHVPGYGD